MDGQGLKGVVRHYQSFDSAAGTFTASRNDYQYARLLGVNRDAISRLYGGHIRHSLVIARALIRAFPTAEEAVMDVLLRSDTPIRRAAS